MLIVQGRKLATDLHAGKTLTSHAALWPSPFGGTGKGKRSQFSEPFPGGIDKDVSFEHYLQMEVSYRLSGCLTPRNLS